MQTQPYPALPGALSTSRSARASHPRAARLTTDGALVGQPNRAASRRTGLAPRDVALEGLLSL